MHNRTLSGPGAVALLGSGEYLDAMNEVDSYLLNTIGGVSTARVVLLPTASGLETDGPAQWNKLGVQHFKKLGVKDIRPTNILDRASAAAPEQLERLKDADLYYFSGGNPQHIIESLRDTPAWECIMGAYKQGAILAGCSAGAMMLSSYTLSLRKMMADKRVELVEALSVVPNIIVFPHFDRTSSFIERPVFLQLLRIIPKGHIAVGIDEETALVSIEQPAIEGAARKWRVMGRQTVKVFSANGSSRVLYDGDEATL